MNFSKQSEIELYLEYQYHGLMVHLLLLPIPRLLSILLGTL